MRASTLTACASAESLLNEGAHILPLPLPVIAPKEGTGVLMTSWVMLGKMHAAELSCRAMPRSQWVSRAAAQTAVCSMLVWLHR